MTLESIMADAASVELTPPAKKENEQVNDQPDGDVDESASDGDNAEPKGEVHEEEDATEEEPAQEAKPAAGARDYARFDPEDQKFLKQMSRPAFEHFSKKLLGMKAEVETREAKLAEMQKAVDEAQGKRLPDAWYNEPEAGTISPAYKEAAKKFQEAQAKTHQLTEILDGVEAGELVYDGKQFVPKPKEDESPVDRRLVRYLQDQRQQFYEEARRQAEAANEVQKNFASTYKAAEQHVEGAMTQFFPWVKDEKHPNQVPYKNILKEWPEPFRKHPVVKFASALAVQHIMVQRKMAAKDKELEAAKNLKAARKSSGPIPGRGGAKGPANDEEKPYKLEDFESGKVFAGRV